MTGIAAIAPLATGTSPAKHASGPASGHAQLTQAARQFEAILLRQMLAEARKADFGETPFSPNASGAGALGGGGLGTFREMMDARFADIAAATDALGLGKLIEGRLAQLLPAAQDGAPTGDKP